MLSSLITVVKESMVSSISLITGSSSVFLFLFWQKHERKKTSKSAFKEAEADSWNWEVWQRAEDDSVAKADESGMFPSMLKQNLCRLFRDYIAFRTSTFKKFFTCLAEWPSWDISTVKIDLKDNLILLFSSTRFIRYVQCMFWYAHFFKFCRGYMGTVWLYICPYYFVS